VIVLALTGSIGMGKSTTAGFFAEEGIPVFDADEAVHKLYQTKPVISKVQKAFPDAVTSGKIDRKILAAHVFANKDALKKLEAIIHPIIHGLEQQFIARCKAENHAMVLIDIPLFFENNRSDLVDKVIVVTAAAETQKARVLARSDMSMTKFEAILKRQISDQEKRSKADFVIFTDKGFDDTHLQVKNVISTLKQQDIVN